jgi:hypothetical protein
MSNIFQKPPSNYLYQVGIANLLDLSAETILLNGPQANGIFESITIPSNAMVSDGQKTVIELYGITNNPNANATIRSRIGSDVIFNAIRGNAASARFMIRQYILRRGVTLAEIYSEIYFDIPSSTNPALVTGEFCFSLFGALNGIDFSQAMEMSYDVTLAAGDSFTLANTHASII